jgi:preprotein translocase subunit SecF
MKINIIKHRYWYFLFSLLIIIPGIIGYALWGLPLSIDFTSGSILEVRFEKGKAPQPAQVVALYTDYGFDSPRVQTAENDRLIIRSKDMPQTTKQAIVDEMQTRFNSTVTVDRFDTVGPTIGAQVTQRAFVAVALAALGILAYITFAFRKVNHAFRYGVAAIIAMIHDILVVISVQVFLSHFLGWEVDSLFLTALLTVIGFSVHDTIVVFDRLRENSMIYRRVPYETVVNHSIVQTLDRSIMTTFTVLLVLFILALFGGVTIRHFVIILFVGILSGAYSSIFDASPILVVWENREWRTWFKGKKPAPTATP